jgi:UPF0716 protein FxsA
MIIFYGVAGLILLEIAVFIMVAGATGFFTALFLCFMAGLLGAYLVQQQGLGLLTNMRGSFERGEVPVDDAFDAACIMAAGILMILPGFISDVFGFALLIPMLRKYLRGFLAQRSAQPSGFGFKAGFGNENSRRTSDPGVIDADFVVVRDDPALPSDNNER